ncbi:MAG TPA: response regulator transcription factor [Dehalococcoidia bacterium]|nr:response regulator transcription factor [Dehalococcoidia bacterium]
MATVLVVDDEPTLVATLRFSLERDGYQVLTASDGEEALSLARGEKPDLVILDLMLEKMHGFEVCRALRKESRAPIIMLTARTDEIDRVVGLEIGADDYVTKPFSMKELMARVRVRLRRWAEAPAEQVLVSGDVAADVVRREVFKAGETVTLRPKEFDLLVFMMEHRGRVIDRGTLLQEVWGYDGFGQTRTVDVHVGRLREKIEDDVNHPAFILTVRGKGYRFAG